MGNVFSTMKKVLSFTKKAVEFPSHRHPLELLRDKEGDGDEDEDEEEGSRICGLCGKDGSAYECNFTAHLDCAENPPSLVIEKSKIHEHTLTLLPRHVSFTCNACGDPGDKSPYVCHTCCFMIHRDCMEFPNVIRISRHQHRLSHTWFLGPRKWNCGVCRQKIDGKYGAYNCTKGCSDAFHLRCALKSNVWDGKELEGEPEEDYDEIEGFKRVGDGVILHFSHQHVLRLVDEETRDVVCSGCSLPFTSNFFYRCEECDFFLHEKCANLPRKMNTFLHVHPLALCMDDERSGSPNGLSRCNACDLHFNGFSYRCLECDVEFDVTCSSVAEPFQCHIHPHVLFFQENKDSTFCSLCNYHGPKYLLTCLNCRFNLCFACATLPDKAIYKYDDHLLSHTISEEDDTTNPDWCDVCENKIDGKRHHHHYECSDCGPVLHTDCAVGSFRNMKPGFSFTTPHGQEYQVVFNDRTLRYRCIQCHNDCHGPLLLMSSSSTTTTTHATTYLCSSPCFKAFFTI